MYRLRSVLAQIAAFIFLSAFPGRSDADAYPKGYDWHASDPLLYDQIVVDGVISSVDLKQIDKARLGLSSYAPNPTIAVVHLTNTKYLRGARAATVINAKLLIDWPELVGRRAILCANWKKSLDDYIVTDEAQMFLFSNGHWDRIAPPERLQDDELHARLESVQPRTLAKAASIVVAGKVVATSDSVVSANSNPGEKIRRGTLEVLSVSKGSVSSHLVRFSMNQWEARAPRMRVGEEWLVMLQRKGKDYWVLGGVNGLLRIGKDDQLLYDGVAPVGLTKAQFERSVKEAHYGN